MTEENKSLDLFGIKGVSDSIKVITEGSMKIAEQFLEKLCYPVAEEYGLMFRDKVKIQRAVNTVKILNKAQEQLKSQKLTPLDKIHPRLVHLALEEASWAEEDEIQNIWAGLLTSSISLNGKSDDNLIFMNLLKAMSCLQVKILKYGVENSHKFNDGNGLVTTTAPVIVTLDELKILFAESDLNRLDRELDHLREIGLIQAGIQPVQNNANLVPTALGINLYVRAQGSKQAAVVYFNSPMLPTFELPDIGYDKELMERFKNIEKRGRELLIKAVQQLRPKEKQPTVEEMNKYTFGELTEFIETFGFKCSLDLKMFALLLPGPPLAKDPGWKKEKAKLEYAKLEKQLDNFALEQIRLY